MMPTSSSVPTSPSHSQLVKSPSSSGSSTIVKNLIKELSENLNANADHFIHEDFDLKSFTSSIVKTSVLSDHLAKLSQNINILDKEIREQVSVHHEDLMHQAIHIETLEEMLDLVQSRIASLKSTTERLRLKIATPYNELNLRILQLSRLQAACDTLRRIKGILHHSAKLKVYSQTGVKEIVKSAQCLNELDFLLKDFDASGIEIVEADVHFAHKARHEVEEQALAILEKGLTHQDQTQIGTALQVFYSLNVLTQKLTQCLKKNEKNFQKTCADLLDTTNLTLKSTGSMANLTSAQSSASLASYSNNLTPQQATLGSPSVQQFPGRTTMPNVGSMSQFRAQLWSNVEKLMDSLYDSCAQVVQLQQILEKKKDLLTNFFYIDEVDLSVLFTGKMSLSSSANNQPTDDYLTSDYEMLSRDATNKIQTYDSIYAVIDPNEHACKKTVEFLYEQWRCLTNVLCAAILAACNQSNYIKQTFQNEYPKLLKLQNDLWLRLLQLNPLLDRYRYLSSQVASGSGGSGAQSNSQTDKLKQKTQQQQLFTYFTSYELMRKCFFDLENSYLNRSLSHLFDPINLIFSQSFDKQINKNDIETYLKGIQTQLQTIQHDTIYNSTTNKPNASLQSGYSHTFSEKIISNICKSIQMYANKSEQVLNSLNIEFQQSNKTAQTTTTTSANMHEAANGINNVHMFSTQLPTQIQMKNLEYVNVTHDLHEQLSRLFGAERLSKKLEEKLNSALKSLVAFEENALSPFVFSASECVLAILLTMHQEDFSAHSLTCSLYMKELQQVLQRVVRDYLHLYNCKQILNPSLNQLGIRCVDLFIRHASILRPMSNSTRQRLINDSQQLEVIIQSILCPKLTDLGVHYKELKAFRHLLSLGSPLDVSAPSSLGPDVVDETFYESVLNESLTHSVLLHYLFTFAPMDLKSPMQSLDWSAQKYSEWLDKHTSEKERLIVVKNCLEAYVGQVRARNEKKFASVYPLMIRLLEKSLQKINN